MTFYKNLWIWSFERQIAKWVFFIFMMKREMNWTSRFGQERPLPMGL